MFRCRALFATVRDAVHEGASGPSVAPVRAAMYRVSLAAVPVFLAVSLCARAQPPGQADRMDPTAAVAAIPTVYSPMTGSQRLKEYFKNLASPLAVVGAAAAGGVGQWRDRPREWKEGDQAYGRRVASAYAEHIVRQTLLFGASSAFREDNRYFRSPDSAVGSRVKYAVGSTFLARGSDGSRHVSFSRILAFGGAAVISRLWQPRSAAKMRNAGINFGTSIGTAVGFEVVREFWPHRP